MRANSLLALVAVGALATPACNQILGIAPPVDPVAAPLLGEHTKDVLCRHLGYDDNRIAALAATGALGKVWSRG